MTARELLDTLSAADCGPTVEGDELVFERDFRTDLAPLVELLQTGLRAVLTGRRWFGIDSTGRGVGPARDGVLNPASRLPSTVTLLTVEGCRDGWDKIDPKARDVLPQAFEPAAQAKPSKLFRQ